MAKDIGFGTGVLAVILMFTPFGWLVIVAVAIFYVVHAISQQQRVSDEAKEKHDWN